MKNFLRKAFKKSKSRKKGVAFEREATIHEVSKYMSTPSVELWYNANEAELIRSTNKKVVELMNKSSVAAAEAERKEKQREREQQKAYLKLHKNIEDKMGECTRGLECHARENKRVTKDRRKGSFAAVFAKQEIQMMEGYYNPDAIAKLYSLACRAAVQDAIRAAQLDEQFVKELDVEELSEHLFATIECSEQGFTPASASTSPPSTTPTMRGSIRART